MASSGVFFIEFVHCFINPAYEVVNFSLDCNVQVDFIMTVKKISRLLIC